MTIQEIIKKYNIRIHDEAQGTLACDNRIGKDKKAVEFVKANKVEIIKYIKEEKEAKERAKAERAAKIAAIEGLEEIRNARADMENWHYEFKKSFEDVGGMGVRPKPEYDFDALAKKYPRAIAYLKAEAYGNAANYAKAAAGRKAKERIINGEDENTVITEMEAEWKAYCDEHVWD